MTFRRPGPNVIKFESLAVPLNFEPVMIPSELKRSLLQGKTVLYNVPEDVCVKRDAQL